MDSGIGKIAPKAAAVGKKCTHKMHPSPHPHKSSFTALWKNKQTSGKKSFPLECFGCRDSHHLEAPLLATPHALPYVSLQMQASLFLSGQYQNVNWFFMEKDQVLLVITIKRTKKWYLTKTYLFLDRCAVSSITLVVTFCFEKLLFQSPEQNCVPFLAWCFSPWLESTTGCLREIGARLNITQIPQQYWIALRWKLYLSE